VAVLISQIIDVDREARKSSYPWPVHTMTGFAHLGYKSGQLPVTERLADQIFSLPMYPTLGRDDQERVIDTLRTVLAVR